MPSLSLSGVGGRKPEEETTEDLSFPFPLKHLSNGNNKMPSNESDSLRREAVQFFCGIMVKDSWIYIDRPGINVLTINDLCKRIN